MGCVHCRKGVGVNSILCTGCSHWIHKKCSSIRGRLTPNPPFKCSRCFGTALVPLMEDLWTLLLLMDNSLLLSTPLICYLGDIISAGGGCEAATVTRVRAAWGKFQELLPILGSKSLSSHTHGRVYSSYVRGGGACFMLVNAGL